MYDNAIVERQTNLDIVRIISALMVLSVHIGQHAGFDFSVGARGVQLFFILSGYLGMLSFQNSENALQYYIKRAKRIFPTYYVCLLLLFLEDWIIDFWKTKSIVHAFSSQCGQGYLRYVFFIHQIIPNEDYNMWVNHGALWTMSSFVVFYLLVPYIYKLLHGFWKSFIALTVLLLTNSYLVSFIASLCSGYGEAAHIDWFSANFPLAEMYCFMFGVVLFWAIKEEKENIYGTVLVITIVVTQFSWYSYEIIFALFMLIAILVKPVIKNPDVRKLIEKMSTMSFALYLIHPIVLYVAPAIYSKLIGETQGVAFSLYLYVSTFIATYFVFQCCISKIENRIKNVTKKIYA